MVVLSVTIDILQLKVSPLTVRFRGAPSDWKLKPQSIIQWIGSIKPLDGFFNDLLLLFWSCKPVKELGVSIIEQVDHTTIEDRNLVGLLKFRIKSEIALANCLICNFI